MFPRSVVWVTLASTARQDWLAARAAGIGGSDLNAILGSSPFSTAWALWARRAGLVDDEMRDEERLAWGTALEDVVAGRWARIEGCTVRRVGMVADPVHPWRRASIDRVVVAPGTRRAVAVLEVKTTSERSGWDTDEDLLARYEAQLQWYLGITGLEVAHLAVLVGGQQLRQWTVAADPDRFAVLCDAADRFWHDHVQRGVPPPLVPEDSAALNRLPADGQEPPAVLDDPELAGLVAQRDAHKQQEKAARDAADLVDAAIKQAMGSATELVDSTGRVWFTWRAEKTTSFDTARLKADDPDLYQRYVKRGTKRVLRVKKVKEQQ